MTLAVGQHGGIPQREGETSPTAPAPEDASHVEREKMASSTFLEASFSPRQRKSTFVPLQLTPPVPQLQVTVQEPHCGIPWQADAFSIGPTSGGLQVLEHWTRRNIAANAQMAENAYQQRKAAMTSR